MKSRLFTRSPRRQLVRHSQSERLGSLEVDHQLELDRGLDWKFAWFCALEDAVDIGRCAVALILCSVGSPSRG